DCVVEVCGDGVLQAGLGEACDDGGVLDGDGCSAACVVEVCGDGVVQDGLGEACDDGNTDGGDGCSSTCQGELCTVDLRAFAWSVFAEQDLTARVFDVGGPVAAGRRMNLRRFSVAEEVEGTAVVGAAADDLRLEDGQVHGNAVWRARQQLRRVTFPDGGALVRDRAFDFRGPWAELEALAIELTALPANGAVAVTPGGVTLTGTDPLLNVFEVSATRLQRGPRLTVDAPEGSTVLVRVRGRSVTAAGVPMVLVGVVPEEVLLLFPGATSVNLTGSALAGTVVAPDATVDLDGAELTGAVLARAVLADDAVLFDAPFDGGLPCP
ncbi:MAG: choice-of-anchor A family protein, partial [Myxococcota bacterium]